LVCALRNTNRLKVNKIMKITIEKAAAHPKRYILKAAL